MPSKIVRNVIVDSPASKDLFRGKGHERTALSLAKAIRKFDDHDRAIGLDGPWGSGKSSIVEIAARHLRQSDAKDDVSHHFFTFDIWKSQGTGFRRSFLEHFVAWAKKEFPHKVGKLQEIEEDIRGKKREVSTNNQPVLGWFGIAFLFVLPLMPIYYFWAKSVFDQLNVTENVSAYDYIISGPGIAFIIFALSVFGATVKKKFLDGSKNVGWKMALSSVLLISSKQHQDYTSIQRIREIDPNDYEFHETLRSILSIIQRDQHRVVVVLDNIDRLPTKEIQEYWALARSIFSSPHRSDNVNKPTTITAIIPYDRVLIEKSLGVDRTGADDAKNSLTRLSARELFSKTFDEILTVAPPVMSNAREFFATKLDEALPKQVSADEMYRTYRIFIEALREDKGLTTPRQVVSFVNDVSGIYALHDGKFALPTVAAYLAHQDKIIKNPTLLNDPQFLDPKVVSLADDDDLAKNLAAIVFNVDPEIAFEVLLDNDLAAAIIGEDHVDLLQLSQSAGFDLRVDDVIQSNTEQWRSTGDLGRAITNFAAIFPSYNGSAKQRIVSALCKGFDEIERFPITEGSYKSYLLLFDISGRNQQAQLMASFLRKGFENIKSTKSLGFDDGRDFAKFLGICLNYLEKFDLGDAFKKELARFSVNSTPDFIYGLALDIAERGLSFKDLGSVELKVPEGESYFETMATDNPGDALIAMRQFALRRLLKAEEWISVANACGNHCSTIACEPSEARELLELVCFARYHAGDQKGEVKISQALQQGTFYKNLGDGQSEDTASAIALAFFLIIDENLEDKLSVPLKRHPNGTNVPDAAEEFNSFAEIVAGRSALTEAQASLVAKHAKQVGTMITRWTAFAQDNRSHIGCQQVAKIYYSEEKIPAISVFGLAKYFDYLRDLLGENGLAELFSRFEPSLNEKSFEAIKVEGLPVGFLLATWLESEGNWRRFHSSIDAQLQRITKEQWNSSLAGYDKLTQILVEKVLTSGCNLESSQFKEPITQFMLDVLSGKLTTSMPDGTVDILLKALDESYHGDIFRTIREKISDVGPVSLAGAASVFPKALENIISEGERVSASEKDNIVRHILCPALEGNLRSILVVFVSLGNRRVSEFRKGAQESTKELLDAAVESFSRKSDDRGWTERVMEVVQGKRRAKNLLEVFFGVNGAAE